MEMKLKRSFQCTERLNLFFEKVETLFVNRLFFEFKLASQSQLWLNAILYF